MVVAMITVMRMTGVKVLVREMTATVAVDAVCTAAKREVACVDHPFEVASGENSLVAVRVCARWLRRRRVRLRWLRRRRVRLRWRWRRRAGERRARGRRRAWRSARSALAWREGVVACCGGEAAWRHLVYSSRHKAYRPP